MNREHLAPCTCPAGRSELDVHHMLIEDTYFVRCDFCDRHTNEFVRLMDALSSWKNRELVE